MNAEIFQVPGYITKVTTMSQGLRMYIDTQETLSPEEFKRLFDLYDKLGWFTFLVGRKIEPEDVVKLPELKQSEGKSPSQRQRAVLFLLWQQNNEGYEDFELYYRFKMEKVINWLKEKIQDED